MTPFSAVAGLAIDAVLGEPPARLHPVVWFGSVMRRLEQVSYRDHRSAGLGHLVAGVAIAAGVGTAVRRLVGPRPAAAVAVAVCAAGRMLDGEAKAVADLCRAGDLHAARLRVRSLVGRDTDLLDATDLSRAVIESVAENSVDAVVATLWWGTIAGAPGVLVHRAVNTLDAMVGHRNEHYGRFGWASARLDDVVNFVPARLAALGVALARPRRARAVQRTIRRDASAHPSPNGGVIEAAYAAALDVGLGGSNRYGDVVENRGRLGRGRPPSPDDVRAAIWLRQTSTAAVAALLCVARLGFCLRNPRNRPSLWHD